ncbi:unnamed protein product [Urochloa humidicola]
MEGQVRPASAAGGLAEQSQDGKEARKQLALSIAVFTSTSLLVQYVVQTVLDHGDEPALLVLELSTWLCFLFYLWVVYITRVLLVARDRLGVRALLGVLAWIMGSVAASLVAYTAISAVAAMLLMYPVTLCVTGLLACCLRDYLRTENSTETISTSASRQLEKPATTAPDESQNALIQKKSSAKEAKLAHEHSARDLEAGLLISEA